MWIAKKARAFTLMELLVAIAISIVVVGLSLGVLFLFDKNLGLINGNYESGTQMDLLEQQLTLDFQRYPLKIADPGHGEIKLYNALDSIAYSESAGLLSRNNSPIYKGKFKKTLFLRGEEVEQGTIDAIKLEFGDSLGASTLFITLDIDAKTMIQNDGH